MSDPIPTMDEAMARLAVAVEAAKAKAVSDALAAQPAAIDPTAVSSAQESTDANKVTAFADQIDPPVPPAEGEPV